MVPPGRKRYQLDIAAGIWVGTPGLTVDTVLQRITAGHIKRQNAVINLNIVLIIIQRTNDRLGNMPTIHNYFVNIKHRLNTRPCTYTIEFYDQSSVGGNYQLTVALLKVIDLVAPYA